MSYNENFHIPQLLYADLVLLSAHPISYKYHFDIMLVQLLFSVLLRLKFPRHRRQIFYTMPFLT